MSRMILRTNTEKINTVKRTKYLSTILYDAYMYMRLAIGKRYIKVKEKIFFIPELIFFGSGLYAAKILSKITVHNGATMPVAIIIKLCIIISVLSIAYNVSEIIKNGVKWWRSLK